MEIFSDPSVWVSLMTLTLLEVILGIDNLIFISIIAERLPAHQRQNARLTGIGLALAMRIVLLFFIAKLFVLSEPILVILGNSFSWRDLIFLFGGLFLIAKATIEIVTTVEGEENHGISAATAAASVPGVIIQIVLLDMVFSVDSILTAFGLTQIIPIMVIAIVIAMIVMVVAAKPLSEFVNRHLSIKILALTFLVLIGVVLIADGFHLHIPRPYIYFALAFSLSVQALTLWATKRRARSQAS